MNKKEALNQLQELIEDHKNFFCKEKPLGDYVKDIEAIECLMEENKKLEEQLKRKDEAIDEASSLIIDYLCSEEYCDLDVPLIADFFARLQLILQKYKGDSK